MHRLTDGLDVTAEALPGAAQALRADGWRFVTATCVPGSAGRTVIYHFEREERLRHLRVQLAVQESVPAIDDAYPAAFLVENEMHELQGLSVTGLSVDYEGRLFRDFDAPEGWVHVHTAGAGETVLPQRTGGGGA